jgi:hypothetical protein
MPFGGYEHDKTWDPPPQKTFTNRFIIASVALAASIPFDVEMTQRCIAKGTCVEGNGVDGLRPSRGEMYKNDLIPAAAVWGFSVLVQSRHFPKVMGWVAYIPMLYGTTLHVKGGLEGLRH